MALNLKKAKSSAKSNDGPIEPIRVGRYVYQVESGETKKAETGTKYIEFVLSCQDENYKNRKVWTRFYLTENAQVYLVRFLEALGLEALTEKESVTEEQIIREVVGKKVSAMTEVSKTNNGNTYNEVKNFKNVGGEVQQPVAETEDSGSSLFD